MCQSHFPPQLRCITAVESPESLVPPRFGDLPGRGGPHVAVAVTVKPNPCIVCARRILLLASLFPDLVVHSATALVVILSYSSFLLLAALCTNRDIVFGNSPRHSAGCGCRRPLHHSSPRPKGGWQGLDLAADGPAFPGQPFCGVGLRNRCASHAGEKNRRDTTSSPRRARPPANGRSCALPARRGWTISSPSCAPYAGLRPVSGASASPGGRSLAMSPRYPDQRSVPARTPCRPTAARSRQDTSPQPTRRPRGRPRGEKMLRRRPAWQRQSDARGEARGEAGADCGSIGSLPPREASAHETKRPAGGTCARSSRGAVRGRPR